MDGERSLRPRRPLLLGDADRDLPFRPRRSLSSGDADVPLRPRRSLSRGETDRESARRSFSPGGDPDLARFLRWRRSLSRGETDRDRLLLKSRTFGTISLGGDLDPDLLTSLRGLRPRLFDEGERELELDREEEEEEYRRLPLFRDRPRRRE
jgi:hypothetical protein